MYFHDLKLVILNYDIVRSPLFTSQSYIVPLNYIN